MALTIQELRGLGACCDRCARGLSCSSGMSGLSGGGSCGCGGLGAVTPAKQGTHAATTMFSRELREAPVRQQADLTRQVQELEFMTRQPSQVSPRALAQRIWSVRQALTAAGDWAHGFAHRGTRAKEELLAALEAIERRVGVGYTSPFLAARASRLSGLGGLGSWPAPYEDPIDRLASCIRVALCRPTAFCCPGGADPIMVGGSVQPPPFPPPFPPPPPPFPPNPPPFLPPDRMHLFVPSPSPEPAPGPRIMVPSPTPAAEPPSGAMVVPSPFTPVPALPQAALLVPAVRGEEVVTVPSPVAAPTSRGKRYYGPGSTGAVPPKNVVPSPAPVPAQAHTPAQAAATQAMLDLEAQKRAAQQRYMAQFRPGKAAPAAVAAASGAMAGLGNLISQLRAARGVAARRGGMR